MKKFLFIISIFSFVIAIAQPQEISTLLETSRTFTIQGDYENAQLVLNRALQQNPNHIEVLRDLAFVYYLKRDFEKAIEFSKKIMTHPSADAQCYQISGLIHRSVADFKEAEKVYKKALKLFPSTGILYNDYGEMLVEKKSGEPLSLWEKGIEIDPNYSGNYYHAAKIYAEKNNYLWAALYAEQFINLESFTARSAEIKNLLLDQYKKIFTSNLSSLSKKSNSFSKRVLENLFKQSVVLTYGVTVENLIALRTRFILDWDYSNQTKISFRLFDYHRQLLQEGMFESYNQWLFGAATGTAAYLNWQTTNNAKFAEFMNFIKGRVYKIPDGQYYNN